MWSRCLCYGVFEGAASVSASTGANDASASLNPHFSCGATNGQSRASISLRNRFKTRATFRTDFPDTEILTAVYVRPFNDCGTSSAGEPCATEGGMLAGRSRLVVGGASTRDYAVVVDTASGDPGRFSWPSKRREFKSSVTMASITMKTVALTMTTVDVPARMTARSEICRQHPLATMEWMTTAMAKSIIP